MNKVLKKVFLFALISLSLIVFLPSTYAATISQEDNPGNILEDILTKKETGATDIVISNETLTLLVINYSLITIGLLSLFFEIFNIVKVIKYKNTPFYDKKYARRIVYFLIVIALVAYLIFMFNQKACASGIYDCGGFRIQLAL